ncbi:hypothetical protein B5M09_013422 [Aphanomyces astaci]|uniref:Uncharacterized protein n=1 Tax=Aphanomyces astaci TaxID=112090 RepID=A0A3R7X8R7_APHAT|nr:hypothetical protein B5M09_013422 [Aphanomyces astaci]
MPHRPPMVRNPVVEIYSPRGSYGGGYSGQTNSPAPPGSGPNGVIMMDPSVAEVTLRDLLVVEDPASTTVVLLALRLAAPEETALVSDSPTHPWSLVRLHVVRIFDDRVTSCGSTETVREYSWRVADASREAGLQANRAVVMMINGCSDAEVAACLRGASVRPETIEISLDYLIERDVDIDRRTDGSRSAPRTTPVAPSTPTRSTRNTSRTQSSSTPNGNLQELQASISRLQRDMTSLTTSNNDQFSSIQDVVAMISTDNPAAWIRTTKLSRVRSFAGGVPCGATLVISVLGCRGSVLGATPKVTDYRSAACPATTEVGARDKPERDTEDEEKMQPVTPVGRWTI